MAIHIERKKKVSQLPMEPIIYGYKRQVARKLLIRQHTWGSNNPVGSKSKEILLNHVHMDRTYIRNEASKLGNAHEDHSVEMKTS